MMKWHLHLRPGEDARLLWLLTLCVLLGGAFHVQTRYQTAIAASHDRTERLYRQTVANARLVREAAALKSLQRLAEADLARVSHDTASSTNVANLLLAVLDSAERFKTRVLVVQPETMASTAETAGSPHDPALESTGITIRVRGEFRSILRFVEDLSHHATLISVSGTEMEVSPEKSKESEPQLDATVHATLYRLDLAHLGEQHDASAG